MTNKIEFTDSAKKEIERVIWNSVLSFSLHIRRLGGGWLLCSRNRRLFFPVAKFF